MAADRERAAEQETHKGELQAARRKQEIEGGVTSLGVRSAVRRPTSATGMRRAGGAGGLVSAGGGSVVRRPVTKRVGRGF